MPAPRQGKIIGITVFDIYGNILSGASVLVTIDTGSKTKTTGTDGKTTINLYDIGAWTAGDSATITASKTGEGSKTETLVLDSAGGQKINITLEEEEVYEKQEPDADYVPIRKVILIDYAGDDINHSNPLPVKTIDSLNLFDNPETEWTITRSDGQPDEELVTIRGVSYKRTFTYNSDGVMIKRSRWIKQ